MKYQEPQIGDVVVVVDAVGAEANGLVTAVHSEKCINAVSVSTDEARADRYGRQIDREPTSLDHVSIHGAHGNYWRWPTDDPWMPEG